MASADLEPRAFRDLLQLPAAAAREVASAPNTPVSHRKKIAKLLKEGIHRRRRSSQGSNPLKGGRPYLIPTTATATNKSKSTTTSSSSLGDSRGSVNSSDWEFPSKSRSVEEGGTMASDNNTPGGPLTSPRGPVGERPQQPRKPPVRNITQPEGTFAYTVDKNDTLTSIAARFETTPSELVKINRLASRLICPGKVIFVPEKSADEAKSTPERRHSSPTKDYHHQGNLKAQESPPSDIVQSSPKPGRAERVCDSPSPPNRSAIKFLSREEEQKLDQECIERFLKINNVKHITDGQGVVSGVLLVTPNAAMFEPSVMETLVSERGIDKYHVSAPLQNVANAALYTDIAHMKVRTAPVQATSLPPPEIYYPKPSGRDGCEASDGEPPGGQPKRSESQQAVKGSVSDKADLELSEEDEEEDSVGSGRSESKGSEKSGGSEVFTDSSEPTRPAAEPVRGHAELDRPPSKARSDGASVRFSDLDYEDGGKEPKSDHADHDQNQTRSSPKKASEKKTSEKKAAEQSAAAGIANGRVPMPRRPLIPDSLWPLSQSLPSAAQPPPAVVTRKHSNPDAHQPAEKARLKVLKRLSYPLSGNEPVAELAAEAAEDTAAPLDLAAPAAPSALSRILNAPRSLVDFSVGAVVGSEDQPPGPTALSRILNSPRHLVDFSTGLFQRNTNDVSRVEDVSQFQRQMSYSLPTPVEEDGRTVTFFGERRGSSPEGAGAAADAHNAHAALGRRFSDGAEHRPQAPARGAGRPPGSREDIRIEFKSEVTLEDKKDLFQNIDVIGAIPEDFEIVPVPARSCEDPPLYLCLRMGRPAKAPGAASPSSNGRHERRPRKPLKSEYWFSIPKDRVDELYHFIEQWAPGAYGNIDEMDPKERGLELISADELSDDDAEGGVGSNRRTADMAEAGRRRTGLLGENNPDWEVVSMHDVRENRLSSMSLDLELPLPELIGDSEILTEEHRREIFKVLPARAEGYSWSLIFSAAEHGFSLQSMYRRMARYESPVLLIIQDTENNVFGAMTSCILKTSDHFYGTGESFLFTFYPKFKTFKWTGDNVFFIKGNPDCLAIGAGDGLFGLWLDGDLYHGRSHRCKTYDNDTLSSNEDFCVKQLEAWGFVDFGVLDSSLC